MEHLRDSKLSVSGMAGCLVWLYGLDNCHGSRLTLAIRGHVVVATGQVSVNPITLSGFL